MTVLNNDVIFNIKNNLYALITNKRLYNCVPNIKAYKNFYTNERTKRGYTGVYWL